MTRLRSALSYVFSCALLTWFALKFHLDLAFLRHLNSPPTSNDAPYALRVFNAAWRKNQKGEMFHISTRGNRTNMLGENTYSRTSSDLTTLGTRRVEADDFMKESNKILD